MQIKHKLKDIWENIKSFARDVVCFFEDNLTLRSALNLSKAIAAVYFISALGIDSYILEILSVFALFIILQYPENSEERKCDLISRGNKDEVVPLISAAMILSLKLEIEKIILPRNESTYHELSKVILSQLNSIYKKQQIAFSELKPTDINEIYIDASELQKVIDYILQNKVIN